MHNITTYKIPNEDTFFDESKYTFLTWHMWLKCNTVYHVCEYPPVHCEILSKSIIYLGSFHTYKPLANSFQQGFVRRYSQYPLLHYLQSWTEKRSLLNLAKCTLLAVLNLLAKWYFLKSLNVIILIKPRPSKEVE